MKKTTKKKTKNNPTSSYWGDFERFGCYSNTRDNSIHKLWTIIRPSYILMFRTIWLQWGIHVTKWLGAQSLLLFLAPLQVGCFRISRFIPDGFFFSNKAQSMRKIKLFLVVSAILQSGRILENIRRMFFVKIHVHCPGDPDWQQKHSSNVLKN